MKKKKIIIILIIIAVIIIPVYFFITKKEGEVEYVTEKVKVGNLIQTVSEVGTVKAIQEIELNFLQTGKVANMLIKIGDKVEKDQVLSELDYSSLSIKQEEANANIEIAKAKLNKLLTGSSPEEIGVKQANVNKAKASYESYLEELEKVKNTSAENIAQAEKELYDLKSSDKGNVTPYEQAVITAKINLNNTKSTYQQAVDNKQEVALTTIENKLAVADTVLDNINTIITDDDAKSVLSINNKIHLTNTVDTYNNSLDLKNIVEASLAEAKADPTKLKINQAIDDTLDYLNEVFASLNYCYDALESSITTSGFSKTDLDAYKTIISTQITAVTTAKTSLQTANQDLEDAILNYQTKVASAEDDLVDAQVNLDDIIKTAENSLSSAKVNGDQQISIAQSKAGNALKDWEVAKTQLTEIKSSPRTEDVSLNRAQVKQSEASLNLIKKQIEDSIIKAPIDGIVTKVEYEIGEQTSATKPAIYILGENNLEVEVDISEADVAKINIRNPVEITLDAFGDDIKFSAKVYFIEPAETIIQDVIYYKVKILFNTENNINQNLSKVKTGMTANAVITTAQKGDVLIMPNRAIVQKNGNNKYAQTFVNGEIIEVPIEIGLRGDEGMVEILSGVNEGDEVVTYVKNGQ
ncbi:MAG: efflux RND transporter periplasmic adaptor subunit [Patescibacteria group bacterium]